MFRTGSCKGWSDGEIGLVQLGISRRTGGGGLEKCREQLTKKVLIPHGLRVIVFRNQEKERTHQQKKGCGAQHDLALGVKPALVVPGRIDIAPHKKAQAAQNDQQADGHRHQRKARRRIYST